MKAYTVKIEDSVNDDVKKFYCKIHHSEKDNESGACLSKNSYNMNHNKKKYKWCIYYNNVIGVWIFYWKYGHK